MGRFNSKAKGSAFERQVCRTISLFWSAGIHADLCWRSAASGARGTVTRTRTAGYHGDIVSTDSTIDPLFKVFCFETKHYRDFDVAEVLRGNKTGKLMSFWKQTLRSARLSRRFPVLIVKPNFFGIFLIVPNYVTEIFRYCMNRKLRFVSVGGRIDMFMLDDFLAGVDRQRFLTTVDDVGTRMRKNPNQ